MENGKTNAFISQNVLLKAFGHKYIRRIPKKNGKGFWYIYAETFKKPFRALSQIFGIKKATISENYKAHNIERDYGASQTTYAAHVLEYFTNREKWDALFSKEENRKKYRKPQKPKAKAGGGKKTGAGKKRSGGGKERKPSDDAIRVNRSLMYKVWKTYGSGKEGDERSRAMEGNQNAKKDGAEAAGKPQTDEEMRREKEETEKARKEAGLPPVREDLGQRVSLIDDLSWNPNDENYRYKDTGYIAGARKEKALSQIRNAGKDRERLREEDIDWEAIEENGRAAKEVIVKSNIFGQVDWAALKEGGMTGGAAFLLDRVYAAVGKEPAEDSAEARRAYVIGVNGLRDRLEQAKTVDDVKDALREIHEEMSGRFVSVRESPEAKERWAEAFEIWEKAAEVRELKGAKNQEYYNELHRARERTTERVKAFLKENKAIKGNQRVYIGSLEQYKGRLSPEKWKELLALKERAAEEEEAKAAPIRKEEKRLNEEYEALYGEYKKKEAEYESWLALQEAVAALSNPLSRAWAQLGKKFIDVASVYNSKAFMRHMADARRGAYDDWAWAEKEKIEVSRKGEERKVRFEFLVAQNYSRKGGRDISAKSTEELKKAFNLRDIQSGNWVLNDPESAKWHVDRCAEGFADLCDVTGIPDNLISLNGRLALAIGARGNGGSALAHYESVERVINITKMKGGGSLAHEWFHAFDNMIMEAMGGSEGQKSTWLTNKYYGLPETKRELLEKYLNAKDGWRKEQYKRQCEAKGVKIPETPTEEHQIRVAAAFDGLARAMTEGNARPLETIEYSRANEWSAKAYIREGSGGLGGEIYRAGSLGKAVDAINAAYGDVKKDSKQEKQRNSWVKLAAVHYLGAPKEGEKKTVQVGLGKGTSEYMSAAKKMDGGKTRGYWSETHEMAARAFSAYVDDKLRGQGRLNDYLANFTHNKHYLVDEPYPEGEERARINAAFDKLFRVVAETNAIRKALAAVAKRKRWLWVDGSGKIWVRKGVLKAWKKAMAE